MSTTLTTGFTTPSLAELIDRVQSDINARLPGADSRLRRSLLEVLSRVQAGSEYRLYSYLDYMAQQVFVDTANGDYLNRWSSFWGVARKTATPATGTVALTGVNGSAIPVGAILRRGDGVQYQTTSSASISAGVASVAIKAQTPGVTGNSPNNTSLTFASPITGVTATATSSIVAGGGDTESDDALRLRILARIQQPPQGGSATDYSNWALAVTGVTRAWVYPLENGLGTVTVRFMMDDTYPSGIPLLADVQRVQTALTALKPVTAILTVAAPVALAVNFGIQLRGVDTPEIRTAITAELTDLIRRDAQPGGTLLLSRIREAISIAAGESDHVLTSPIADVVASVGQIPTMGAITWA